MYLESLCVQRAMSPLSTYVVFSIPSLRTCTFPVRFGLVGFNIFYHPPCIAILARRRLSKDIKPFLKRARSA